MSKARFIKTSIAAIAVAVSLSFVLTGCYDKDAIKADSPKLQHEKPVTDKPYEGSRGLSQIDCNNRYANLQAELEDVPAEDVESFLVSYYLSHKDDVRTEPDRTDINGEDNADLEWYLIDRSRSDLFEGHVQESGPLIVQGLLSETFGEVRRNDVFGTPLPNNYTGWGGIRTFDANPETVTNVSVWAWWTGNRYIDPNKIHAVRITDKNNPDIAAYLDGPEAFDDYWSGEYTEDGITISARTILRDVTCLGWGVDSNPDDNLVPPASLQELRELDRKVIDQFKANVVSWDIDDLAG